MNNPPITQVAVSLTHTPRASEARELAEQLALPVCTDHCDQYSFVLQYTAQHLELQLPQHPKLKPIYVDFTSGKLQHRQRFGGGRGQLIARAVGLKPGVQPTVVDVTAGLGEDAFVLATLGCSVIAIERHPIVAALLRDGLARLGDSDLRFSLQQAEAIEWLATLTVAQAPDVIYLDPMFPHRDKSALVKKEMRMLRELVGGDEDAAALFAAANRVANKRVVVKRPRHAPTVTDRAPDVVFAGKSCRYDVYLMHR